MDDTRIHDALHELAGAAPEAPALWDRTRRRITRRRRRRIGGTALAVVGVLAIGAGVVTSVTTNGDDDADRISAGPSAVADARPMRSSPSSAGSSRSCRRPMVRSGANFRRCRAR